MATPDHNIYLKHIQLMTACIINSDVIDPTVNKATYEYIIKYSIKLAKDIIKETEEAPRSEE